MHKHGAAPKDHKFQLQDYKTRTRFNTYMKKSERRNLNIEPRTNSRYVEEMEDIMQRSRAYGMSIEAYFQAYGTMMHHGVVELTF